MESKPKNEPTIRAAKPGDESGIHEAHMRSIREVCVKDHGEEEIKGWGNRPLGNRWIDPIRQGNVWVVEMNDIIHGVAYLQIVSDESETKAYLNSLYLTPEVLNKGLGKKLTKILLDKAKELRISNIRLDSSITAHEFYKRHGFVDSGPAKKVEIGGHAVTCYPMELRLNS